jgi:phospholipase/carboxylesterase
MKLLAASLRPALPDAAFILPDAPEAYDGEGQEAGLQWFSMKEWFRSGRDSTDLLPGLEKAADTLNDFIDEELRKAGLPDSKLVLVGFSQGAMTALYTGLRRPKPIAGILAYSGRFVDDGAALWRVPVHLVHGGKDQAVPPSNHQRTLGLLQGAGVPVTGTLYPDLGHEIGAAQRAEGKEFLGTLFKAPNIKPPSPGMG